MERQIAVDPTDQFEPPPQRWSRTFQSDRIKSDFSISLKNEISGINFWNTGKHSEFPSKCNWDVILSQPGAGRLAAVAILI